MREHHYRARLSWNGNLGPGTTSYERYDREFSVGIERKPELLGSAAAVFRGNATRHDPEDWLLAALAGCHMLAYLALCARRGVIVVAYEDDASGTLTLDGRGGGRFTSAILRPTVTIADPSQGSLARAQHEEAHERCFIASSVAFPVTVDATIRVASPAGETSAGVLA